MLGIMTTSLARPVAATAWKTASTATAIAAASLIVSTSESTAKMAQVSKLPELEREAYVVEVTVDIDVPAARVWSLLGEQFDQSIKFNPEATKTSYILGTQPAVGAQRRTINTNGKFIDVEVVDYDPSAYFVGWEIIDTDVAPIKFGFGRYQVTPISENRTRLKQQAGFKMKYGPMDVVARFKFPKVFVYELAVIKHTLETGKPKSSLSKNEYRARYFRKIKMKKYF